jgi:hypothetical protein
MSTKNFDMIRLVMESLPDPKSKRDLILDSLQSLNNSSPFSALGLMIGDSKVAKYLIDFLPSTKDKMTFFRAYDARDTNPDALCLAYAARDFATARIIKDSLPASAEKDQFLLDSALRFGYLYDADILRDTLADLSAGNKIKLIFSPGFLLRFVCNHPSQKALEILLAAFPLTSDKYRLLSYKIPYLYLTLETLYKRASPSMSTEVDVDAAVFIRETAFKINLILKFQEKFQTIEASKSVDLKLVAKLEVMILSLQDIKFCSADESLAMAKILQLTNNYPMFMQNHLENAAEKGSELATKLLQNFKKNPALLVAEDMHTKLSIWFNGLQTNASIFCKVSKSELSPGIPNLLKAMDTPQRTEALQAIFSDAKLVEKLKKIPKIFGWVQELRLTNCKEGPANPPQQLPVQP